RPHTRCYRDWSSDVCSSDLVFHRGLDDDRRRAVPASSPAISGNCRRTSATISWAARPTAVIVQAAMKNGTHPPTKKPITTLGFRDRKSVVEGNNVTRVALAE